MVRTCGSASSNKRFDKDFEATAMATTSKRGRSEPPPLATQPVAASVVIEATARPSPPILKGSKKKVKPIKATKDTLDFSSADTLPSGPNSPLSKSPLSYPEKSVGSLSIATTPKSPAKPSLPVAFPISKPTNLKPSFSKPRIKERQSLLPQGIPRTTLTPIIFMRLRMKDYLRNIYPEGLLLRGP